MSDQQFQRERKRHPDQLATEVITLRGPHYTIRMPRMTTQKGEAR